MKKIMWLAKQTLPFRYISLASMVRAYRLAVMDQQMEKQSHPNAMIPPRLPERNWLGQAVVTALLTTLGLWIGIALLLRLVEAGGIP